MGAISEKLVYLNGTKQAIKQAINEDFEVIDNNTTFREYADEISSNNAKYKDLIPKETKNATNTLDISNSSGLDKALVTQYGNTYQETTTGKNLLPTSDIISASGAVSNGITFTLNSDGSIKANGTATGAISIYINADYTELSAGIYTFSDSVSSGESGTTYFLYADVRHTDGSSWDTYNFSTAETTTGMTQTIPEGFKFKTRIVVRNGQTLNNVVFKPMLEVGSSATSYEPYTNGASPNPDYPQDIHVVSGKSNVKVVGKNLFDINTTPIIAKVFYDNNGNKVSWGNTCGIEDYIKVIPDTIYSIANSLEVNVKICFYDNSKTYLSQTTVQTSTTNSFTTPNNANYIRFGIGNTESVEWVELDLGNTTPTTHTPYISQTYPISLGNIELCKIGDYKDRIYPLNGKWYLEKKIGKVVLNGSESGWDSWYTIGDDIGFYNYLNAAIAKGNIESEINGKGYCNMFSEATTKNDIQNGLVEKYKICGTQGNSYLAIGISKTKLSDYSTKALAIASFKTWLGINKPILYYVLATPTTEEITESNYPTLYNQLNNIKLFEGVNHITMTNESGLDVEFDITYYKDWKLD